MATNRTFADFGFNKQLLNAIADKGYDTPTPIQEKAIPAILAGQDVMGIAQTGTGKTAAYVLPMLMKVRYAQGIEPRALVLVPTRELAMQVSENISVYARYTDIRQLALYGGLGPKTQIAQLQQGVDIIIATPGRLLELYLAGHVVFKKLQFFVMDEADRLMDMGFISQIHRLLEVVPLKRQNLLFSATMSPLVHKIAGDFLEFPTVIEVAPEQKTAITVSQTVYKVPNFQTKLNLLQHLAEQTETFNKVILFCKTKTSADRVFGCLERNFGKDQVRVIHGNKGQNSRINAMHAFKEEQIRFLVATDVAARGIDITLVSHVVNIDVPIISEDYVHRIGRTGRALQEGDSITFCTPSEEYFLQKITKLIKQKISETKVPKGVEITKTPYEEQQEMNKEIDRQKRKEDPTFQGAFHEKKSLAARADKEKKRVSATQSKRISRR